MLVVCAVILSISPIVTGILPRVAPEYIYPDIAESLAVLSGIASAVFFTAWHEMISINDLRQSGLLVGTGFFIASLITILSETISYDAALTSLAAIPIFSLFLILRQTQDEPILLGVYQKIDSIALIPLRLILLLGFIYITGGIMLSIIGTEQSYTRLFYLTYLAYALCPIVGLILYLNEDIDLRFMYRLFLVMMFIGFLTFCLQPQLAYIALALLQGASALLNMYAWLLFPYFARFSTRPASICAFGLLIALISTFSGYMIVGFLSTLAFGDYSVRNLAFIAGVIGMLTVFLFPERKETFSGWLLSLRLAQQAPANRSIPLSATSYSDTVLEQSKPLLSKNEMQPFGNDPEVTGVFDSLPLSSREKDVLIFLLKGRNSRFISEALNISSNTVKFHMRNIYSKLSVHNRQDLLNLYENKFKQLD